MTTIVILIVVLLLLNIVVILLYVTLVKCLPATDDKDYYDENGHHVYYDRKLIRQLAKEKQNH